MGNLGNAKILGGVGAILMLVGGLATQILSIVGMIMILVAIKYISDEVKDSSIFSNFLLFIVINIIATIALIASVFYAVGGISFFAALSSGEITDPMAFFNSLENVLVVCILGFIIFYVLNVIAALYLKKSFDSIAKNTKVDMFKTTGLVFFIGAILIILVFGFFIMFIAEILMIIAFFSLPETLQPAGATQGGAGYAPPQQTGRMCTNCGRSIPMDAQICPYCNSKLK